MGSSHEEAPLKDIANLLRRDSLMMTTASGSGHPTTCLSCAEMISALFFHEMRYDVKDPFNPDNDEFILSKGHASPVYYAALSRAGCINHDLMKLRQLSSPLEGHPMPSSIPWAKVATGSLGQGLAVGVGMAIAAKLQKRNYRTYVLLGDSELAEGSVYEALQLASHYKLDNLCALVDVNRLGQRGETMLGHDLQAYRRIFESFGWSTSVVDGHDTSQLVAALTQARASSAPTAILAKTLKGKGVSFLEDKNGWHGKTLNERELQLALQEIGVPKEPAIQIISPEPYTPQTTAAQPTVAYQTKPEIATRLAYGQTLAKLARENPSIVVVDAEVSNSTHAEEVKKHIPSQFIESFVAEQAMVSIAAGLAKKGMKPFASTFAAFLTRAHDQIRMAALSSTDMVVCGSHAGVSIGEDGASQMGLEDISMFRTLPNSTVLYPSDGVSTEKLVRLASTLPGVIYIRTTRAATPNIYTADEIFEIGGFKVVRQSDTDSVVIAGAGITLHESLKAQASLSAQGIQAAVVDIYSIKPFNASAFASFVKEHGNQIVVAEDHYPEGGIGEMLKGTLNNPGIPVHHLAVRRIPHSGKKDELLDAYGINSTAIVKTVRAIMEGKAYEIIP